MNKITNIILAILILCCAGTAAAQERGAFEPVSARVTGIFISSADYEDSSGSSTVAGGRLQFGAGGFSLSYEGRHYSWSNVDKLNFGNGQDDPWNSLHRFTVGYSLEGEIGDGWFYGAGITGSSAFEEEIEDSFGGAVRGHVGYIFNEHWRALLGARAFINSINYSIMPYLGVNYSNYAGDGSGYFMNLGAPATELGYSFSGKSAVRFKFELDGKTYRLKDNSAVSSAGYVEFSSMVAGLYYDCKPFKGFSLSVGPEYHFGRETKFFDKHGNKIGGGRDQDSAIGGILSFRYRF